MIHRCSLFQFVEFKPEDQDVTLLPVKLPLKIKTELDVKSDPETQFTQVKVKSEPMDVDEVATAKAPVEEDKPKVFNSKQAVRPVTCTDLFANPTKSGTHVNLKKAYLHFRSCMMFSVGFFSDHLI